MVRSLVTILLIILSLISLGQEITSNYPSVVVEGQQFTISYEITSKNIKELTISNDDSELNLLNKRSPSKSSSNGLQIINGKQTVFTITTLTFSALPKFPSGQIKLPILTATVDGKVTSSKAGHITVVSKQAINGREDFLASLELSSNVIFEGETVIAELKVYYSKELNKIETEEFPSISGVTSKKLEQNGYEQGQSLFQNKLYNHALIGRFEIITNSSGNYTIPEIAINAITKVLEPGGGYFRTYREEKTSLKTQAVELRVIPLVGQRPQNYLGVFSQLQLKAIAPASRVDSDQALELELEFSGKGNFTNIQQPDLKELKVDFQVFDPEIIDNFKTADQGSKTYKFTLVPKKSGNIISPSFSISYFNSTIEDFQSLTVPSFQIQVESTLNSPNERQLDDTQTSFQLYQIDHGHSKPLLFSTFSTYFVGLLGILVCFLAGVIWMILKKKKEIQELKQPQLSPLGLFQGAVKTLKSDLSSTAFKVDLIEAIEDYVVAKFHIEKADFTKERLFELMDKDGATQLKSILVRLEIATFGGFQMGNGTESKNTDLLDEVESIILRIDLSQK